MVCTLLALLLADDTTLLASSPKLPELINYINFELYKIATYFRNNKLALHPSKTTIYANFHQPHCKKCHYKSGYK
jgi:hypothetical protein